MEDYYEDYVSEEENEDYSTKPVPIWLSVCLVIAYIVGGAFIFQVSFAGLACRSGGCGGKILLIFDWKDPWE